MFVKLKMDLKNYIHSLFYSLLIILFHIKYNQEQKNFVLSKNLKGEKYVLWF